MNTNIRNLFKFLEVSEGRKPPLKYKILYDPETITNDDLLYNGHLNFEKSFNVKLPDNLTINGTLDLAHSMIKELPKNLKVSGNLHLVGSDVSELPPDLIVSGDMTIRGTKIDTIPKTITVGGILSMDHKSQHFTKVPKHIDFRQW